MLILTRRPGEGLSIGSEITMAVLSVKGSRVRIGINAPKDVRILRDDLLPRSEVDGHEKENSSG